MISGHSDATVAWLLYVAAAVLGACLVATLVLMGVMMCGETDDDRRAAASE